MVAAPAVDPRAYAMAVQRAVRVVGGRAAIRAAEGDWRSWLPRAFGGYVPRGFAAFHAEYWDWLWSLEYGVRARPFVGIWPRGYAKSTSAELGCVVVAARRTRRYGLYVSETQEQSDNHVANVAGMLESAEFAGAYPEAGSRRVGKYGNSQGWRRNRLRTGSGFTLDAIGLDTAARGVKVDEDRPDFMCLDDLDGKLDSPAATEKKITTLTHTLIPARADGAAVLAIQNLVLPDGIFARLAAPTGDPLRADWLADRVVSGPHPAVRGLTYERDGATGKSRITGGEPTWPAMGLDALQAMLDEMGLTAFLAEEQHEVSDPAGGMFDHLDFRHCRWAEVPDLVRVVVWVDPAVTSTDRSDAQGIQADGVAASGDIYRLRSWEGRTTPEDALRRALLWAEELRAEAVGVETDQGGDTWDSVYRAAADRLVAEGALVRHRVPRFRQAKAGAGFGPKAHRASQMLPDYERGRVWHVVGTHEVLERALRRFPRAKPFDLTDAAFWSWHDLRHPAPPIVVRSY